MYEQNYAGGQSTSTTDPDPAPNLTEGWLWRRAKITYDKGWYRLEDGEFFYLGSDPSSQKKGESLGKVSGAVTTSEDRLEFTLCAPLATLEAARLALPRPMPTLASRPPPRGRHGVQDALLQLSRREPEGVQPLDGRLHAPGELRIEVVSRGRLYRWLSRTRHCYVVVLVVGFGSTAGRGPGTRRTRTGARARGGGGGGRAKTSRGPFAFRACARVFFFRGISGICYNERWDSGGGGGQLYKRTVRSRVTAH